MIGLKTDQLNFVKFMQVELKAANLKNKTDEVGGQRLTQLSEKVQSFLSEMETHHKNGRLNVSNQKIDIIMESINKKIDQACSEHKIQWDVQTKLLTAATLGIYALYLYITMTNEVLFIRDNTDTIDPNFSLSKENLHKIAYFSTQYACESCGLDPKDARENVYHTLSDLFGGCINSTKITSYAPFKEIIPPGFANEKMLSNIKAWYLGDLADQNVVQERVDSVTKEIESILKFGGSYSDKSKSVLEVLRKYYDIQSLGNIKSTNNLVECEINDVKDNINHKHKDSRAILASALAEFKEERENLLETQAHSNDVVNRIEDIELNVIIRKEQFYIDSGCESASYNDLDNKEDNLISGSEMDSESQKSESSSLFSLNNNNQDNPFENSRRLKISGEDVIDEVAL